MKLIISLVLLMSIYLFSCSADDNDSIDDMTDVVDDGNDTGGKMLTLVNYTDDIIPILEGNCYNCHGPNPTSVDAPDLLTYDIVVGLANNISDRINARGNNDPMPPSGLLNADVIAIFDQWIVDGLLEN